MDQRNKLTKALIKNTHNPTLAWHLFKRILSIPTSSSSISSRSILRSIPIITHILIRAKMISQIDHLQQLLLQQPQEVSHVSLIALIRILAKSGLSDLAFSQFQSFRSQVPANPPQFISIIWFLSPLFVKIRWIPFRGCRFEDAREVFDKMGVKGCRPNEFSFGILVRGYCRAGLSMRALELLDGMGSFGVQPNKVIYNTLISSFCREGRNDEAERLVERMREDGLFPDVVTFNSRISALCSAGKILEASRIFRDMQIDEELGLLGQISQHSI
ncbi:Pentatricopeptide repeat-containing protein [Vitis vinifera]|uniref:Pentatricopeptide repeat-containing protein n=1 Tax=Vitis vinifera TaxID=29760 RepID=A0A438EL79_VITVI|nr:Pentatricopeptide repeat-containing protein [Vitis vinifera]